MNVLIFAGASEGRALAERLSRLPVTGTLHVATEYGSESLGRLPANFTVRVGRLDARAIVDLVARSRPACVVDATHPYAAQASANIRAACEAASLPLLRITREAGERGDYHYVESVPAAAAALMDTTGNVLLTTGAKELAAFIRVPDYAERMFPRVLPSVESVGECVRLGFRRGHIVAMQGPFGRELNRALMRQFAIAVLVTKDGGTAGGFSEKTLAARDVGARVVVVGRPPEKDGLDMEAVVAAIAKMAEARG